MSAPMAQATKFTVGVAGVGGVLKANPKGERVYKKRREKTSVASMIFPDPEYYDIRIALIRAKSLWMSPQYGDHHR